VDVDDVFAGRRAAMFAFRDQDATALIVESPERARASLRDPLNTGPLSKQFSRDLQRSPTKAAGPIVMPGSQNFWNKGLVKVRAQWMHSRSRVRSCTW